MFQKEVYEYVSSIYDGVIIENDRNVLGGIELDIYVSDKNFAIECNGNYWHSELQGKGKNYHLDKTEIAERNNLHLIHIFEDEWLNKDDIIKNKLKSILGLSEKSIYARNCEIREITTKIKTKFLIKNHIQGTDKSNIKLGLFYENELVGVMTFSNRRIALGKKSTEKGEYELSRFATSTSVVGGASKLFSYFVKKYHPLKIVSYADRRWTYSKDNLYNTIGFDFVGKTHPNYFYTDDYEKRLHRFNFPKHRILEKYNGDKNLTEWENMQLLGYDRIWDCGSLKYEKII